MRLPAKKKHSKKTSRLPLYLLLAVLVTSLATTGTLAKYKSTFSATASMQIAAFAGGGTFSVDFAEKLDDMYPGDTRILNFAVQNYEEESGALCDVVMNYEIRVNSEGNLPLTFSLLGNTTEGAQAENSVLVPDGEMPEVKPAESETPEEEAPSGLTYVSTGGKLPFAGGMEGSKAKHLYQLSVNWPKEENDMKYIEKTNEITVTVTATQANPQGE